MRADLNQQLDPQLLAQLEQGIGAEPRGPELGGRPSEADLGQLDPALLQQLIGGMQQEPLSEEEAEAREKAQLKAGLRRFMEKDIEKEVAVLIRERQAEIEKRLSELDNGKIPGRQR